MISHRWHETLPNDKALHAGEWAGIRSSTPEERRAIGVRRNGTCNTFVFQGCGHVLRLIVASDLLQPSFSNRLTAANRIRRKIAAKSFDLPQAYSSSIFAAALALAPPFYEDLQRVRRSMRCSDCNCIFREGGPLQVDSKQGAFARDQVRESVFANRSADK